MKVVCINDKNLIKPLLKEDEIYTIIGTSWDGGFLLKEVYNGEPSGYPFFYGYDEIRFIPLDDYLSVESEIQECLTLTKEIELV